MKEIRKGSRLRLPHYRVYTRLGCSEIKGVGVFAIRDIKKGTRIFYGDSEKLVWLEKRKIEKLPEEIRKFYKDFCVFRGDLCGCPKNFNNLTVSWYLNHSKDPNVVCDQNYDFFALRDIKKGEELTVDYETYSDE